ncbi:MAG: immunoglobulin domain-containing protein, partial [Christensenella sp.]
LKAAGNNGYRFTGWYKDDVPILGTQYTSDTYQFTVSETCKITANFEKASYLVRLSTYPTQGGTLTCDGKTPDEKGYFTAQKDEKLTLNITANPQYALKQLKENGVPVVIQDGKYVFTPTKDVDFSAEFEKKLATIDATAIPAAGGTIEYTKPFVKIGEMTTVGATENAEYVFKGWFENGAVVSTDKSYTFNVKDDTMLRAWFQKRNYTVTVTSGEHGVTSPSGALFVRSGADRKFVAAPNTNYYVARVIENGIDVNKSAYTGGEFSYTMSNITQNSSLDVLFDTAQQPIITLMPTDKKAVVGGTVTLETQASISDGGALSYQWKKGKNDIAGATQSTLTFKNIQSTDAASYQCVITNTLYGTQQQMETSP